MRHSLGVKLLVLKQRASQMSNPCTETWDDVHPGLKTNILVHIFTVGQRRDQCTNAMARVHLPCGTPQRLDCEVFVSGTCKKHRDILVHGESESALFDTVVK